MWIGSGAVEGRRREGGDEAGEGDRVCEGEFKVGGGGGDGDISVGRSCAGNMEWKCDSQAVGKVMVSEPKRAAGQSSRDCRSKTV